MTNRRGKNGNSGRLQFFGGSKITADGVFSHEIKRRLLLGKKAMTSLLLLLLLLSCFSCVRLCAVPQMGAHCLWDSLGKNTGVGCHFLLQCIKVKSKSEVAQSSPTLSDPMDCSLSGSSVHGIFQARVQEYNGVPLPSLMTSLDNILKGRDVTLPTKVCLVKVRFFQQSCTGMKAGS